MTLRTVESGRTGGIRQADSWQATRIIAIFLGLLSSARLAGAEGIWVDVPLVHQELHGCGSACIAMLMRYWAGETAEADPRFIQQAIYSSDVQGILGSEVERYLGEHGFRTFVFRGEWADLEQHLSKGRPLMICLHPPRSGPLHYVVVSGIDPQRRVVIVNDPARRKLTRMDQAFFERNWKAASYWTLLAVPKEAR